jgi:hypothetical protein
MADRYWVGGTGTWNTTSTTNWSTTSGGASGASVPTAADNVFFDQAATYSVTMTGALTCANLTVSAGTVSFLTGTSPSLAVSGSFTIVAATVWSSTATITFNSTTTGNTITTNGVSLSGGFTFNGVGGGWTLGSALTLSGSIVVTAGTFDTGNYAISATSFSSSGTGVRTINFGSSAISLSTTGTTLSFAIATNLTFNCGTSTISLTGVGPTLTGSGQTFYNVAFTAINSNTRTINGANTFNDLTFPTRLSTGVVSDVINANQTINGTFSVNAAGTTALNRHSITPSTAGTTITLTCAAVVFVDVDFRDVVIAGAAAPASGTRLGDLGGNSGITFTTKTVYRVGTNTSWGGSSSWATSSGGAGSDANLPLAQDTAIIDDGAPLLTSLSLSGYNMSTLDSTARTISITFTIASATFYGSYKLSSAVTLSGAASVFFAGRTTMDFLSAGKTITFSITLDAIGGTLRLQDAFTYAASQTTTHNNGTLDLNGYTLTAPSTYTTGSGTKNLTFNGGTFLFTGSGSQFLNSNPTGYTTTAGTGTGKISFTSASSKIFAGGGSTFNCTLSNDGAGSLRITGNNTITTLANGVSPTAFAFTAGTTTTLTNWNITGTAGNLVTIGSATAASHTLSKASGTVNANYLSISRSTATGGATWNAGANSTDGGNNSGWIFTAPSLNNGNFFLVMQ